ncbi:MAG: cytochrome c3 family protein [Thermodesulfobacteriota bacterium]
MKSFNGFRTAVLLFAALLFALPSASIAAPGSSGAPGYAAASVPSAAEPRVSPHSLKGDSSCTSCHREVGGSLLSRGLMETCTHCHKTNNVNHPVYKHPVNIVVKSSIPSPMPLSKDRKLVCTTCHDPHSGTGYEKMLRVRFQKLCVQCHSDY